MDERRYARQLVMPEIGASGQARLQKASVLVVGVGGLGNVAAAYLAAAGVGTLGLVDHDRVELSNLSRQILYETADAGRTKVEAAEDALSELNPDVNIITYNEQFSWVHGAWCMVHGQPGTNNHALCTYDLVLDGTDNFNARFAIQDACFAEKKTLISAAVIGMEGQISTFKPHAGSPCYRCFVHSTPQETKTCAQAGVLGPAAGVMGSLMAVEAMKELLGIGQTLAGRVMVYDALAGSFRTVVLKRDPECPLCAHS